MESRCQCGRAEGWERTGSLATQLRGHPRSGTALSQSLLQESQTSSLSEPLLGGHLVACHPEPSEAEGIKKRWQEYTEELYKKDLHDPDNHDMITNLEPDILECEVKCALGSITTNKASGDDGIPVELFQIQKDDAVKVLHSICQQIWKTQQWPQDWKRSVFIPFSKKGNAKECSNYHTIALISHVSWTRQQHSTSVLLPGKSHEQRSLVGYSSWGHRESDTTERLHFHFSGNISRKDGHNKGKKWYGPKEA